MRITWYGHAAFLIEADGLRIVLDPYRSPDSGGYRPIAEPADVVVVSHENDRYHSHLGQVVPPFEVVRALELPPEGRSVRGVTFRSIRVFETPRGDRPLPAGDDRGGDEVTIIHFRVGGRLVAHLGDLGHGLTPAEVAPIAGADVVLLAAGGPPTIDYPEIPALLDAIGPGIVVPMHYKTPGIDLAIQPVGRFLAALPGREVAWAGSPTIEVRPGPIDRRGRVVVLDAARL